MPKLIKGADLIRDRYREQGIANQYESNRFNTLLGRLIHLQEVEAINEALSFRPSNLLEVAVGPGRISKDIKLNTTPNIIGMDSSFPMLKIAKQNVQDEIWSLICGDAMNLPFHDGSFDTLVTFHCVRHLTAPERTRIFREFSRVLRENGILVIDAMNANRGVIARGLDRMYRLAERWQ